MFLYTGTIEKDCPKLDVSRSRREVKRFCIFYRFFFYQEIKNAAALLELSQLTVLLENIQANESFLNEDTIQHYTLVSKTENLYDA